jgi:hypothetical protein
MPPTSGILNDVVSLQSGKGGGRALQVFESQMATLSEDAIKALKHVEAHAVAEMILGGLKESVLHINFASGPCRFCRAAIPELMQEGQKLWVVFQKGAGYFTRNGWVRVL